MVPKILFVRSFSDILCDISSHWWTIGTGYVYGMSRHPVGAQLHSDTGEVRMKLEKRRIWALMLGGMLVAGGAATAEVWHVRAGANGNGSPGSPFGTIQEGADAAAPGDSIWIYDGVYRECVRPPRGGTADARIVYASAPGATPAIRGSEALENWESLGGNLWVSVTPEGLFEDHNPYATGLATEKYRTLGEVYLDGVALSEVDSIPRVAEKSFSWKATESGDSIYANFGGSIPSEHLVEVNVREQVFAPDVYHLGYITVAGLTIEHSANQYPDMFFMTSGHLQKGALSTTGGHDWIIEDCTIRYARSVGIDFGYQGKNALIEHGYGTVKEDTINKALGRVGHHRIRRNKILDAGTTGMMGMWAPFSIIEHNLIKGSNRLRVGRYEHSALKTHYFMHGIIRNNFIIGNNTYGMWIDNNYQGVRITGNVFIDNDRSIWSEMGHGPLLFDNNVVISSQPFHSDCAGVWMINNLFFDSRKPEFKNYNTRSVVVWKPNTIERAQEARVENPPERVWYYNNLMIKTSMNSRGDDMGGDYNLYMNGGSPESTPFDQNSLVSSKNSEFSYSYNDSTMELSFAVDSTPWHIECPAWWPDVVGPDPITNEKIDSITQDILGVDYDESQWLPGPFQDLRAGTNTYTLKRQTRADIPTGVAPEERDRFRTSIHRKNPATAVYDLRGRRAVVSQLRNGRLMGNGIYLRSDENGMVKAVVKHSGSRPIR